MGDNNGRHVLFKLAEYITKMAYSRWHGCLDREEILSEAYVAAVSTANKWPDEITPKEWTPKLGWAAYNVLIGNLQKQRNLPRRNDFNSCKMLNNSESIEQADNNPTNMTDIEDEIKWLTEGIDSDTYQAILLYEGFGYSVPQIAEQLNTSKYHVRNMISVATCIMKLKAKRRK